MFCKSLFVLLYLFFWPLCCLFSFDVLILITPLVSSNSSYVASEYYKCGVVIFTVLFTELGTVMVVIVWYLDLQLPVQSVPIITKVVCSNPVHGEM